MGGIKTSLLVRMWRVIPGNTGPSAEFRLDPFPGQPKTLDDLRSADVLHLDGSSVVTFRSPWGGFNAHQGKYAFSIDQAMYNAIEKHGSDSLAIIDGDRWYSIDAELQLASDMRSIHPRGYTIVAGPGLVLVLSESELASGIVGRHSKHVSYDEYEAMSPSELRSPVFNEDLAVV